MCLSPNGDVLLFQPQLGKQSRERDTKNHARFGPHPFGGGVTEIRQWHLTFPGGGATLGGGQVKRRRLKHLNPFRTFGCQWRCSLSSAPAACCVRISISTISGDHTAYDV